MSLRLDICKVFYREVGEQIPSLGSGGPILSQPFPLGFGQRVMTKRIFARQ